MNTSDNGRYESDESVEQTIRALAASSAGDGAGTNRMENSETREIAELGRTLRASLEWEAGQTSSPVRSAALRERLEAEMSAISAQVHISAGGESKLVQPAETFQKETGKAQSSSFQRWFAIAVVLVALASLSVAFYQGNKPLANLAVETVGGELDGSVRQNEMDAVESLETDDFKDKTPDATKGELLETDDSFILEELAPGSGVANEPAQALAKGEEKTESASGLKAGIDPGQQNHPEPVSPFGGGGGAGGGVGSSDAESVKKLPENKLADGTRAFFGQDSASSNPPMMPAAPGGSDLPKSQDALVIQPDPASGKPSANESFETGGQANRQQASLGGMTGGGGFVAGSEKSGEPPLGHSSRSLEPETDVGSDARDRRSDLDRDEQSDEQYEQLPENLFLSTNGSSALSTFSIDVDTASFSNVRRFLAAQQMPPRQAVRIEEMINSFSCEYQPPVDGRPFAVHVDSADSPWSPGHKLVRIGLKGREIDRDSRPPSNLVFLIDVSGSMADDNKLPLLKRSLLMLVDNLTENDRIAIVTYASDSRVRLEGISGDQKDKIRSEIEALSAGGSTNGSAGIQTAYDLATEKFIPGGTNRVILATDGDLNVGITDDNELVRLIQTRAKSGVFLSVLGFGTGNLNEATLEKLADNGNGHFHYIDDIREAQRVLVAGMCGTLVTIAKDVKLQVEFNPAVVSAWRLIGYENRVLRKEDFENDRVDAGDIGAGHTVTALYEIIPGSAEKKPGVSFVEMRYQKVSEDQDKTVAADAGLKLTDAAHSGEMLAVFVRYKEPEGSESELMTVPVKGTPVAFENAPVDFRFVAAVAGFGMKLRQSAYAGTWEWADVENTARDARGKDPDGQRSMLIDMIREARGLLGK